MRLEEDDSGEEAPSRGADMYHCNRAGKLGLIIPPPSPSSYRRRGGAELRQRTHVPNLRGHKNWGSRAMGCGALTSLHWRLCIMFSSTLAINLVASAKFYFLSGGHLATGRTLKIVSSAVAAPHLGDPSGAGRGGCAAAVISARHGAAKWEDGPGECWHLPPTPATPDADAAFSLVLSHVHYVQPF